MKKSLLYSGVLLNNILLAQTLQLNENKYNLKVKSPDAIQFSKYIDIPNTTHTGTVGIDIPIYPIKVDNYTLPISLKYHASGIKVKEVASKVGLGWSLSIGGISLSKQIFGNEDKGHIPYINQADWSFDPNNRNSTDYTLALQSLGYNAADPSATYTFLGQKRDTQPDIFSYSIGNSSGDFYLDSSGNPIKIGETSVKIEITPYILTDDDGNKYFFSAGNQMRTVGGSIPTSENIVGTDFIINKIVLANGKEVNFEYSSAPYYKYLSSYYKGYTYPLYCQTSSDGFTVQSEYNEFASLTDILMEKYLTKITFPEGYVTFGYTSNREDVTNGLSLDKIQVFDNNNKVIINKELMKSYFFSNDLINVAGYTDQNNTLIKRLKLNEVKNILENSSYKLSYYEDNALPNRLSNATDYVGFYNGKNSNLGIPYVSIDDNVYGLGDNKNPDINFAISGSLMEVVYPTGGKMKLEYELDDFDSSHYPSSYFPSERLIVQKEEMIDSFTTESIINVNSIANQISFTVNFSSNANPDQDSNSIPDSNQPYFIAEILDNNNVVLKTFIVNGNFEFFLDKKPYYKLRIRKYKTPSADKYASFSVKWFEKTIIPPTQNRSVGGIRVKKILKQDDSNNVIEENFTYKDENGVSTGVFMGDPINYYHFSSSPHGYLGETCRKLVISNSGNFNLSTINGKPTVYNKVITERVNISNPNEKWKTIDTYYNSPSSNPYNNEIPFETFVNNQFARGILTKKEIYNSNNILIKKIENEYEGDQFFNQKSSDYINTFPLVTIRPYQLRIAKITKERNMMNDGYFYIPTFDFTRYEITSSWMKLKTQKTSSYFNNQFITEVQNYFYDPEHNHLNTIVEKTDYQDYSSQITSYKYAHEKGNQLLISKNMIGIPLETTTTQTIGNVTKTLGKSETIYPTSLPTAQAGNLVLPLSVQSYDLQSNIAATDVSYDKYDSKGNLQQYTTKDGVSTTIVWGYNGTQPIAKIVGAKLAEINPSLIAGIVGASDTDASAVPNNDETSLLNILKDFRNSLPAYQVSTYTYDPLIGVRSITPPSGIREVYLYDSARRLMEIREDNQSGRLIKEFKYNYKT